MDEPEFTLPLVEPFDWTLPPPPSLNVDEAELKQWIREALPEITAHMEESEIKELMHILDTVHGVGTLGEIVGFFAHHGTRLAALAEGASMFGLIAFSVLIPAIMFDVFTTGMRVQQQKGYCFGVMWAAQGLPDVERQTPMGSFPLSEGELEAWKDGVRQGREAFEKDPSLRKAIILSILYEHATQEKLSITSPEDRVLTRIWEKVHEENPGLRGSKLEMSNPNTMY